jgi:transposase
MRRRALEMYVDGMSFRRIERHLGVSRQTVANWVKAHADSLPDAPPTPTEGLEVEELDEVFTFIEHKKTSSTSSPR